MRQYKEPGRTLSFWEKWQGLFASAGISFFQAMERFCIILLKMLPQCRKVFVLRGRTCVDILNT
ncbi:hypothetical protein AR1Y2_3280 [Anaerostipes rhamnosivorans]|uniref:Uncharacterized protein n=1 Tax=Anaerostipes rhamnosivorans TaxID=1229621 RepID=A0A4P8IL14_9FIRM|nr:hypothetical protein AR1Y2_3280 [Anaerostipes rhamnosivorans]